VNGLIKLPKIQPEMFSLLTKNEDKSKRIFMRQNIKNTSNMCENERRNEEREKQYYKYREEAIREQRRTSSLKLCLASQH